MSLFKFDKLLNQLNKMIDNAINGKPVENRFDETKLSALETKLSRYIAMTQTNLSRLEDEKKYINTLVSDISHQTKTPLANILLYAQLLNEQNLPDESVSCMAALLAQVEKLNFLIDNLVKTSRLETGIISLNPKVGAVSTLLEAVTEQMSLKAIAKGLDFSVLPCEANAYFDLKWTAEAICNIVDNAIKYTPTGGSVKISVILYQMFCRIDISDTGIGINEEEYTKVFQRFYRSPSVSNTEGVGIGLYLSREIIRSQGGYIKLTSKAGTTVFSVFLPIVN